jgi:hypothetical protein
VLHLETKKSRGKLLPHLDLQGEVFLEETPCGRSYNKKEDKEDSTVVL